MLLNFLSVESLFSNSPLLLLTILVHAYLLALRRNNKNKGAHETHQGSLLNPICSVDDNFQFTLKLLTKLSPTVEPTSCGLKDFKGKVW